MKYVLAPNNVFERFILPGEVVQFSDHCQTTAKRLTGEEAAEYGVAKLKLMTPPAFDALTQSRQELSPLLIDGEWVQQWEVVAMSAPDAAAAQRAAILSQITELESRITNRRMREAVRGSGTAWLDNIDDQIAALRAKL